MIELPVLIENIIEIVNVAIEMMLVFLYFSLLSKAKVNKAVLYLSYLLWYNISIVQTADYSGDRLCLF